MFLKPSIGERFFDVFNIAFMLITCVVVILPIMHVVAGSFSSSTALIQSKVMIWPVDFNFDNYTATIQNKAFWSAFRVTVFVVVVGTLLNLLLTICAAYPLSRKHFKGRQLFIILILFTMIFSAPLIPTYLVVRYFGLLNTVWAMIIPAAVSAFNLFLCMTFFRSSIPNELLEAAKVDGMSEYGILWKVVVPLSKPILTTLMLFYAVQHWNNYFYALIFVTDPRIRPLQLYLYQLLQKGDTTDALGGAMLDTVMNVSPQGIQMSTIVVATVPIVILYPFIQKHFIKGALLGSLKE